MYCNEGDETIASAKTERTYKDAGVDIEAGQAPVESVKRRARATERPGTAGDIGGFGALFDAGETVARIGGVAPRAGRAPAVVIRGSEAAWAG